MPFWICCSARTAAFLPHVTYTAQERDYVLEIMRKFRLSYSISPEVELIPALCKKHDAGPAAPYRLDATHRI